LDNDVPTEKPINNHGANSKLDATLEMMRYHLRLGHILFATLKLMAAHKEIDGLFKDGAQPHLNTFDFSAHLDQHILDFLKTRSRVQGFPKRKQCPCSRWLHSWLKSTIEAFDSMASFINRHIKTQRPHHRRCAPASRGPACRSAAPRNRAATILALSAVTLGIARAHTHCDNSGHATANYTLIDGGATARISHDLTTFLIPPAKTKIRIDGFNGASSNAKVGAVKWAILDNYVWNHFKQRIPGPLRMTSNVGFDHMEDATDPTYVDSAPSGSGGGSLPPSPPIQEDVYPPTDSEPDGTSQYDCTAVIHRRQRHLKITNLKSATAIAAAALLAGLHTAGAPRPASTTILPQMQAQIDQLQLDVIASTDATIAVSTAAAVTTRVWLFMPHVPNYKFSPSSQWLPSWLQYANTTIDDLGDYVALLFEGRSTHHQGLKRSASDQTISRDRVAALLVLIRLPGFNDILRGARVGAVQWPTVKDQPPREPAPHFFAFPDFSDEAADNRELYEEDESLSPSYPADILGGYTEAEPAKSRGHNLEEDNPDHIFETVRDLNALPTSKWQDQDQFSPVTRTTPSQRTSSEHFEDQGEAELLPPLPPEQGSTTRSGRFSVPPQRFKEQVCAVFDESDEVHVRHRWPSVFTINWWHYATFNSVNIVTSTLKAGQSSLESFSEADIKPKLLNFHHTFGSVCVVCNGLQGSGATVYLGNLQRHARSGHTPMGNDVPGELCPQGGDFAPHLLFAQYEEQGDSRQEGFNDPPEPEERSPETITRSGRAPPEPFMEQVHAAFDDSDAVEDYKLQKEADDPITFTTSWPDPKSRHYIRAMQARDFSNFKNAKIEVNLGVKVTRTTEGSVEHLSQHILDEVGRLPLSKAKEKAALSSTTLCRDLDAPLFRAKWNYCRIIGKLDVYEKATRPEIIVRPDLFKSFEVHVDCNFSGNKENGVELPSTTPVVYFNLFELNAGAIQIGEGPQDASSNPAHQSEVSSLQGVGQVWFYSHTSDRHRGSTGRPLHEAIRVGPLCEASQVHHGLVVANVIYSTRECDDIQSFGYCVVLRTMTDAASFLVNGNSGIYLRTVRAARASPVRYLPSVPNPRRYLQVISCGTLQRCDSSIRISCPVQERSSDIRSSS
jgi:hypothetical protein